MELIPGMPLMQAQKPARATKKPQKSTKQTAAQLRLKKRQQKALREGQMESLSTFIYKVLKRTDEQKGISNRAMSVMNSLIQDLFSNIIQVCRDLPLFTKTVTLDARVIQTAVRLLFPTELAKCAVAKGVEAVMSSGATAPKGGKGGLSSSTGLSRSARAGLTFPVGRFHRILKQKWKGPVTSMASVYMTAICEYVCGEVLDLANKSSNDTSKVRIIPRHISLAIRGDAEMDRLFRGTIASGGVVPHIHASLLPKAARKPEAEAPEQEF